MTLLLLQQLENDVKSILERFAWNITKSRFGVWISNNCMVLSHSFSGGQWLLIFSGVVFSLSVCLFTYRNSKNPVISLMVFNCLGLFNFMVQGLRQAIAMSICLFAYEQCKKKAFYQIYFAGGNCMSVSCQCTCFYIGVLFE